MAFVFNFPDVGEGIHEGRVVEWLVAEGATVAEDEPLLKVETQLTETLHAHRPIGRAAARGRAAELLGRVRIPNPEQCLGAYPHELSGGMRQRVVIAMALANGPDLVIADEATTALDVTVQAEILALLDRLCTEQGAALIFISHDLGVVAQLCRRVLVMYAGRAVEEADLDRLLSQPAHPYTRGLLACAPELGHPEKPLNPIPGRPPSLNALPEGCHFAPRCPEVRPACSRGELPLRHFDRDRLVRFIRAEELLP